MTTDGTTKTNVLSLTARVGYGSVPVNIFLNNSQVTFLDRTLWGSNGAILPGMFDCFVNATQTKETCLGVTSIPPLLLANCSKLESLESCFPGATEIPEDLFFYQINATSFLQVFYNSTITQIPSGLFKTNLKATIFNGAFKYCSSLLTVPSDLLENNINITDIQSMFESDSAITSNIPVLWDSNGEPLSKYSDLSKSYCASYANGCSNAANYSSIPSGWK